MNRVGESVRLTGQNAYVRYYTAVVAATGTEPATKTPPTLFNLGFLDSSITIFEIDAGDINLTLATIVVNNTWAATGGRLLLEVSLPKNPGTKFPGPKWQSLGVITGAGTATHSLNGTPMTALTFPPVPGQQIWLRARGIGVIATDRRVSTQQILGPVIVADAA